MQHGLYVISLLRIPEVYVGVWAYHRLDNDLPGKQSIVFGTKNVQQLDVGLHSKVDIAMVCWFPQLSIDATRQPPRHL